MESNTPPSRIRARIYAVITLSVPLLCLGMLECGLGWKFSRDYRTSELSTQGAFRFVSHPYRGYKLNPNYVRHSDGVTYRYNNFGFRDEADLGAKRPDEFRVFLMGGSAAYGAGPLKRSQYPLISGGEAYPSSMTIAAYLEEELSKLLPSASVNVINAAVPSYRIHHNYLQYLTLVRTLSPDVVISIDGVNDRYEVANPFTGEPTWWLEGAGHPLVSFLRRHSYTAFYLGAFYNQSPLLDRLRGIRVEELSLAELDAMDFDEIRREIRRELANYRVDERAMTALVNLYEQFALAARLDDVPILLATQPLLALDTVHPFTRTEERLLKYQRAKRRVNYGVYHLARRLQAASLDGVPLEHLDLQGVFADFEGEAYTDNCHLTTAANRHVARRLAEEIQSRGMHGTDAPAGS